jgi:hypothetical protein
MLNERKLSSFMCKLSAVIQTYVEHLCPSYFARCRDLYFLKSLKTEITSQYSFGYLAQINIAWELPEKPQAQKLFNLVLPRLAVSQDAQKLLSSYRNSLRGAVFLGPLHISLAGPRLQVSDHFCTDCFSAVNAADNIKR